MSNLYTLYSAIDAPSESRARSIRRTMLGDTSETFGGYTVAKTEGGYLAANGLVVMEPSIKLEIVTDAPVATVRAWAERMRLLANQESVLLTCAILGLSEFIGCPDCHARRVAA